MQKIAATILAILGVIFGSFVIAIIVKVGWPKDVAGWFVIGGYATLSAFFFLGVYLERKILQ